MMQKGGGKVAEPHLKIAMSFVFKYLRVRKGYTRISVYYDEMYLRLCKRNSVPIRVFTSMSHVLQLEQKIKTLRKCQHQTILLVVYTLLPCETK